MFIRTAFARPPAVLRYSALATRSYATASSPHALLFIEHKDGQIEASSLSALSATNELGGKITGVVIGGEQSEVDSVVEKVKK